MTISWKAWPSLLCCLSLCATGAVSQEFMLQPLNLTVLTGFNASFSATVLGKWEVMTWTVAKFQVLTITVVDDKIKVISTSEMFNATGHSNTTVEFFIYNVTRRQSGPIICTVQGEYGSREAQLDVQESGTVSIMGGNRTARQEEQVEFTCVTSGWFPKHTVGWSLNGKAVTSSLYNTTVVKDGDFYNSTSVLNFQAVSNTTVECWATLPTLTTPISSSVSLVVDPKPPDWTVLIAVVVSISSLALLVLLILGIIFCYKRRKEKQSGYRDEMIRRVRTQSELSGVNAAGERRGQVNDGYVAEGQTGVTPSEFSDGDMIQANGSSIFGLPDVVNSNHVGNIQYPSSINTVDNPGFIKHRHLTIV